MNVPITLMRILVKRFSGRSSGIRFHNRDPSGRKKTRRNVDSARPVAALEAVCALFITNDAGFWIVNGLSLVVLDDLLNP